MYDSIVSGRGIWDGGAQLGTHLCLFSCVFLGRRRRNSTSPLTNTTALHATFAEIHRVPTFLAEHIFMPTDEKKQYGLKKETPHIPTHLFYECCLSQSTFFCVKTARHRRPGLALSFLASPTRCSFAQTAPCPVQNIEARSSGTSAMLTHHATSTQHIYNTQRTHNSASIADWEPGTGLGLWPGVLAL